MAKLNSDWLAGQPLRIFLAETANDTPKFLSEILSNYHFGHYASLGVLIMELTIVPLLLWSRTRYFAFVIALTFHLMNDFLFTVGAFPYLMILSTSLFLPISFHTKLLGVFGYKSFYNSNNARMNSRYLTLPTSNIQRCILILFIVAQLVIPLKSFLYKGNQLWTEEGYLFSWKMMTAAKTYWTNGMIVYSVYDPIKKTLIKIDPIDYGLTWAQMNKLVRSPDLILQFAHHLGKKFENEGIERPQVYVDSYSGLNGRPIQRFIHPGVDLYQEKRRLISPYPFIIPIEHTIN